VHGREGVLVAMIKSSIFEFFIMSQFADGNNIRSCMGNEFKIGSFRLKKDINVFLM